MTQQNPDAPAANGNSTDQSESDDVRGGEPGTAVEAPPKKQPRKCPPRVGLLPQWKVLLHNDDVNEIGYVVDTIVELLACNPMQALLQTLEAHKSGLALLMTTHRERAELICEQFASKKLTVTIEPDC